jgi:hypothetical protein
MAENPTTDPIITTEKHPAPIDMTAGELEQLGHFDADPDNAPEPAKSVEAAPKADEPPKVDPKDAAAVVADEDTSAKTADAMLRLAESNERLAAATAKAVEPAPPPKAEPAKPRDFNTEAATAQTAYDTKINELDAKYEEGEITQSEYSKAAREATKAYNDESRKITIEQSRFESDKAAREARASESAAELDRQWLSEQQRFFAAEENKFYVSNKTVRAAFEAALLQTAQENGAMGFAEILAAAKTKVDTDLGRTKPAAAAPVKSAEDIAKEKAAIAAREVQQNKDTPPVTVASLPSAGNESGVAEFDEWDKMPISDLEDLMGRLGRTDAGQQKINQYLQRAPGGNSTIRDMEE